MQVTKCFVNKKTKQKKSNSNVIKHPIKSDVCIKTAPTSQMRKSKGPTCKKVWYLIKCVCMYN